MSRRVGSGARRSAASTTIAAKSRCPRGNYRQFPRSFQALLTVFDTDHGDQELSASPRALEDVMFRR
jgi:hypothetical protein